MPRYRKKDVTVEAFQVLSDGDERDWPLWAVAARLKAEDEIGAILYRPILPGYCIETSFGRTVVGIGDWIVRESDGELVGVKDADFRLRYDLENGE